MRNTVIVVAAFMTVIGLGRIASAQTGPEQQTRPRRTEPQEVQGLKLSADLVTVLATVTDAAGNHVTNLTADDFTIFEDNKRQDITGVYRENDLPLRLVFLFDTSGSIRHRFGFEQRAAARFFRQVLRPADRAAIISVSTEPKFEVQFTSRVDDLVDALAQMKPGGATSLYSALVEAAQYLKPAEGRHVIVVLSDGSDTASRASLAQAIADIHRADIAIYAVHSTGVAPSANVQDLNGEFVLKAVAEETGGRAFFPPVQKDVEKESRELDEIYKEIAAEVRSQYVLTYYSNSTQRDGRFRQLKVECKRPGVQIRARRGYYAPGDLAGQD
jgi:VWFA-related protein